MNLDSQCPYCGRTYELTIDCLEHVTTFHDKYVKTNDGTPVYSCPHCQPPAKTYLTASLLNLAEHITYRHPRLPIVSRSPERAPITREDTTDRAQSSSPRISSPPIRATAVSALASALATRLRSNSPASRADAGSSRRKNFMCTYCGFSCDNRGDLKAHHMSHEEYRKSMGVAHHKPS